MISADLYVKNKHALLEHYNSYLVVIKNYSKTTKNLYNNTADGFMYFLKINDYYHIRQINKNTFHRYIKYIRQKSEISNRSTNMIIAALNNFAEYLCKEYNACFLSKLKQLKYLSKIPNIMDEKDMLLLLKQKNPEYDKTATWINYRDYAICILLYSTGMRASEAMSISLSDIGSDWIRIEDSKNNKTRVVPTNIHVHISITNYREQCPFVIYNTLWFSNNGKKLTSIAATVALRRTFGYAAHYFRHAFASHLVINGCDLLVVKEFLGHSSIITTSIYVHIKPRHLLEAVKCHPLY